MDNKIRLHVLGLSFSQLQSGAYALVLAEDNGPRRIPVVIGVAEAQSIAICLEGIRTPRPLTHDLFVSFAHAFGVKLTEVFIYKFEDGIFSSELTFTNSDRTIVIDARTSDAIAIALRTRAPIFTTEDIIRRTGFIIDESPEGNEAAPRMEKTSDDNTRNESASLIEGYSTYFQQLEKELS
ncbi:MAG: bifunctional nuclease family protein, partial [Muribaculaceae bacterium]|nr:bifunctional nuclease family protein [Muribaculaceae bacterium]